MFQNLDTATILEQFSYSGPPVYYVHKYLQRRSWTRKSRVLLIISTTFTLQRRRTVQNSGVAGSNMVGIVCLPMVRIVLTDLTKTGRMWQLPPPLLLRHLCPFLGGQMKKEKTTAAIKTKKNWPFITACSHYQQQIDSEKIKSQLKKFNSHLFCRFRA